MKTIGMNINLLCVLFIGYFLSACELVFAQGYDEERVALALFIERMYHTEPFEGCRIVDDYDHSYFLAVVALDKSKYKTSSLLNRVAQVKSQRVAGEFFNGSQTYSEMIIRTPQSKEKGDKDMTETIETIRMNSIGYVRQLQLLTSFDAKEGTKVFIYFKPITCHQKDTGN